MKGRLGALRKDAMVTLALCTVNLPSYPPKDPQRFPKVTVQRRDKNPHTLQGLLDNGSEPTLILGIQGTTVAHSQSEG